MQWKVWLLILVGFIILVALITPGEGLNPLVIVFLLLAVYQATGDKALDLYDQFYPDDVVEMFRQGLFPTLLIFLSLLTLMITSAWLFLIRLDERQASPQAAVIGGVVFALLAVTALVHSAMHLRLLAYWLD